MASNNAELDFTSQIDNIAEQGAVDAICRKLEQGTSKEIPQNFNFLSN